MGHDVQPGAGIGGLLEAHAAAGDGPVKLRDACRREVGAAGADDGSASAQEAQYAAGLVRAADWSPNPSKVAGIPAISQAACASCSGAPPMQERKVSHRAASFAAAYPATSEGGRVRKAWLARGDAQRARSSQAHCRSGSSGSSWRRRRSSCSRSSAHAWMKAG